VERAIVDWRVPQHGSMTKRMKQLVAQATEARQRSEEVGTHWEGSAGKAARMRTIVASKVLARVVTAMCGHCGPVGIDWRSPRRQGCEGMAAVLCG